MQKNLVEINKLIVKNLKTFREKNKYSINEFADKIKIDKDILNKYAKELEYIPAFLLFLIADIFNVSVITFFEEKQKNDKNELIIKCLSKLKDENIKQKILDLLMVI